MKGLSESILSGKKANIEQNKQAFDDYKQSICNYLFGPGNAKVNSKGHIDIDTKQTIILWFDIDFDKCWREGVPKEKFDDDEVPPTCRYRRGDRRALPDWFVIDSIKCDTIRIESGGCNVIPKLPKIIQASVELVNETSRPFLETSIPEMIIQGDLIVKSEKPLDISKLTCNEFTLERSSTLFTPASYISLSVGSQLSEILLNDALKSYGIAPGVSVKFKDIKSSIRIR